MQVHEQLNLTPYRCALAFAQDARGLDVAVALLKATYSCDPDGEVTPLSGEAALPVFLGDQHYGDPVTSSLQYASDVAWTKRGTDVAVNGHAYGRGNAATLASLRVGTVAKTVRVSGPRVLARVQGRAVVVGPRPFDKIPLRYEHSYGGTGEDREGRPAPYPANPVGVGFSKRGEQLVLPSFEDPAAPMQKPGVELVPVGFGFIPPGWTQRSRFAGTFDDTWFNEVRPLFPRDFDERYLNAVPPDQVTASKLVGGERVELKSLSPDVETLSFEVPTLELEAVFRVKGSATPVHMEVDTLLIEPDEHRFSLTFRGSHAMREDIRYLQNVVFRAP